LNTNLNYDFVAVEAKSEWGTDMAVVVVIATIEIKKK
jgi:hypothetical protein